MGLRSTSLALPSACIQPAVNTQSELPSPVADVAGCQSPMDRFFDPARGCQSPATSFFEGPASFGSLTLPSPMPVALTTPGCFPQAWSNMGAVPHVWTMVPAGGLQDT